jgi:hypothetical protein
VILAGCVEIKLAKGRVSKAGRVNKKTLDRRLKAYECDETILRFVPELKRRLSARRLRGYAEAAE